MRSWERHSASIFRLALKPYLSRFDQSSPEAILRKSASFLDDKSLCDLTTFIKTGQHYSGGFSDRAGKPDLYYSLFGFYLARALDMKDILPATGIFTEIECRRAAPSGVQLQCAAILAAELTANRELIKTLRNSIRRELALRLSAQPEYGAFVSLLACYHTSDYLSVYRIRKHLTKIVKTGNLPSTVISALIVLQSSFRKPAGDLRKELYRFYDNKGGFRAVKAAPVSDLLSTAVALYALRFSGEDMKMIKPECLEFIDSHYINGGFCGNLLDPDTDIEYTFYGLLALGSLAD